MPYLKKEHLKYKKELIYKGPWMITVIVYFTIPEGMTREEIILKFEHNSLKWRDNQDLIRKNYLIDLDREIAGGVYLWKEKMHAEIWLGAEFRKMVRDNYGEEPTFQFFETPVVIDNITGDITKEWDLFVRKQFINILKSEAYKAEILLYLNFSIQSLAIVGSMYQVGPVAQLG